MTSGFGTVRKTPVKDAAIRPAATAQVGFVSSGFTYMELELLNGDGGIFDLNQDAQLIFNIVDADGNVFSSDGTENTVRNIVHSADGFAASVTVIDPNYEDWTSNSVNSNYKLKAAPTTSWADYADTSWYNETDTEFTLTTAAQLAGLAKLVNAEKDTYTGTGINFAGKTIKIGNDIDLSEHAWVPIGWGLPDIVMGIGGIPHSPFGLAAPFSGKFDGCGHTISGIYTDNIKHS